MTPEELATERAALVALLHPPRTFKWASHRTQIIEDGVLPSSLLVKALHGEADQAELLITHSRRRIQAWEGQGHTLITYLDAEYPAQFHEVHDFPPFIFAAGRLPEAGVPEIAVSIVGSRAASPDGKRDAYNLGKTLAVRGVTVVSGLAEGIDHAAQTGALSVGGRTVGIIGTGIDISYPRSSSQLQARLASGEGLVVSQFWPGSEPQQRNFPMRNSVMSAYSRVTVIVEADEKSGTRHQASTAVKHGRPLVLAPAVATETSWGRKLTATGSLNDVHIARSSDQAAELAIELASPREVCSQLRLPIEAFA
ncbi:DNA-processing protein DprA [Paeniglutamicibacter psychrophenolicus]|uniref:DNA processing protein n=1 Tax=Paeniglutamicibacter psychrophenolicus TaxID=257454 RepID=A0ABS4WAT0_9MICC|nr:DNA-processing protein DprA [Paeniglutamicibacter psychrophenolicus]MBP2373292.1 DNA processing protein [Paeniglutamicibacter psychrophenolicus]